MIPGDDAKVSETAGFYEDSQSVSSRFVSEFPSLGIQASGSGSRPTEITSGPDGNLWFTEYSIGKIGMISPTTHAISEFPATASNAVWGITAGPDGNLWFTEYTYAGKIGMLNPATPAI